MFCVRAPGVLILLSVMAFVTTALNCPNCPQKRCDLCSDTGCPAPFVNPWSDITCPSGCNCTITCKQPGMRPSGHKTCYQLTADVEEGAHANFIFAISGAGDQWTIQADVDSTTTVDCGGNGGSEDTCTNMQLYGIGISATCSGPGACSGTTCQGASSKIISCTGEDSCASTTGCGV